MSVYICRACVKMVDLDYEDVEDKAIKNTLCMRCQEMKNQNKGFPSKTIGDLLQEIEDLKSQKAALLAACKLGKEIIERLQWDNIDDEAEFDICNSCYQRDYEEHKPECERRQAIESIKSAIEQAGEGV